MTTRQRRRIRVPLIGPFDATAVPLSPFALANMGASAEELEAAKRAPPPFTGAANVAAPFRAWAGRVAADPFAAPPVVQALRGYWEGSDQDLAPTESRAREFGRQVMQAGSLERIQGQMRGEEGRLAQVLAPLGAFPGVGVTDPLEAATRLAGPAARVGVSQARGAVERAAEAAAPVAGRAVRAPLTPLMGLQEGMGFLKVDLTKLDRQIAVARRTGKDTTELVSQRESILRTMLSDAEQTRRELLQNTVSEDRAAIDFATEALRTHPAGRLDQKLIIRFGPNKGEVVSDATAKKVAGQRLDELAQSLGYEGGNVPSIGRRPPYEMMADERFKWDLKEAARMRSQLAITRRVIAQQEAELRAIERGAPLEPIDLTKPPVTTEAARPVPRPPAATAPILTTRPIPTQAGALQASMGIGERPAQGQLLGEFQGRAQPPVPLIDAERQATRAASREAVAQGQAALPEAARPVAAPQAVGPLPVQAVPTPPAAVGQPPAAAQAIPPAAPLGGGTLTPPPSGTPPAAVGPLPTRAVPTEAQGQIRRWQEAVTQQGGPMLPSGRRPGGARAVPLGQQPPPRPPIPPEAPPVEGLPSGRRPGGPGRALPPEPPQGPFDQLKAALEPEREPFLEKVRRGIPQELYDRNYTLKKLEQATGVPARKLAQLVPGAHGAAEDILRTNQLPVVNRVSKDVLHLEQYMVLKRAEDILQLHPGTRLPGGFTGAGQVLDALTALERRLGPERFGALKQAADELWRMNDELGLQALRREGILSSEAYLALKTSHPHYIPYQRADFVETLGRGFTRPEANVSSTGIKTLTEFGSERALDRPLERLLQEMYKTQGIIFRNRAAKGIVEALEEMGRATQLPFVRYIEPRKQMNIAERVTGERLPRVFKAEHSGVWNTMSFYKDGVKHTVEVPAIYADVAKGLEAQPDNVLLQIIRALNAPLRHGAVTYNPLFIPVNITRDAMAALFREKVIPFGPDYIMGMWAAIKKNDLFSEAARSGALMSGIVENMRAPVRGGSRVVLDGAIPLRNPLDALLVIPRLINATNLAVERGVRLGAFRQLRREGLSQFEAAVRARDATVDFAKAGNTMRILNQVIPFMNAAVQGQANILRTIRDHPARSAALGSLFVAPTILSRINNMRYETSDLIPDYEYTRNWVIQVGEGTRKDETKFPIYIKIPKGEIAAMFSFPAEALFNLARETEDRSAAELFLESGAAALSTLSPLDPSLVPTVPFIQTGVGLATGVDPFTKAPIVPRREQNLLPEQQFGPETSATAVAMGEKLKISPRMIDFAIKDYLAGAGQSSNWLLSQGLEAAGFDREQFGAAVKELSPTRVEAASRTSAGRFVGTRGTQLERRGWDEFRQAVEETNRQFSHIEGMNRLGVRLGEVGDSIFNQELTPALRARYQRIYAEIVQTRIRELTPDFKATDEIRRRRLQNALSIFRQLARNRLVEELRDEQAWPPTPTRSVPLPARPSPPAFPTRPVQSPAPPRPPTRVPAFGESYGR